MDDAWRMRSERIFEPQLAGESVPFTVDRTSDHYRFWLEGFGRYTVAVDGTVIGCELGGAEPEQHERFVFAQALPIAAVLQGFEVLHASAVCAPNGAAAFVGVSGTGKTSLASRLVARGADFLTDDVLAVQAASEGVLAHPGPAFMAIREHDAEMLAEVGGRLGRAVGSTDKVHVSPPTQGAMTPLRVIYHIALGESFQISPLERSDFNRILALAFVPYLMTPERLMRHLEITQLVSASVAQFKLQTPRAGLLEPMVQKLEAHLREVGV